jgi:hypothetical protein
MVQRMAWPADDSFLRKEMMDQELCYVLVAALKISRQCQDNLPDCRDPK